MVQAALQDSCEDRAGREACRSTALLLSVLKRAPQLGLHSIWFLCLCCLPKAWIEDLKEAGYSFGEYDAQLDTLMSTEQGMATGEALR